MSALMATTALVAQGASNEEVGTVHRKKKVHEFPVSSRDVTNQTPPGQE
jgi:hypothetical protein